MEQKRIGLCVSVCSLGTECWTDRKTYFIAHYCIILQHDLYVYPCVCVLLQTTCNEAERCGFGMDGGISGWMEGQYARNFSFEV